MSRRSANGLVAGLIVATMAVAVLMANGCGGIDCTETATCAGRDDGSADRPLDEAGEAAVTVADGGAPLGEDVDDQDDPCDATLDGASTECGVSEGPDAGDSSPSCGSGSSCMKPAPTGWFGPGALYDGAYTHTPPACAMPYGNNAFNLNAMPSSPPPSCACACSGVNGGCTSPMITVYADNQCNAANSCGTGGGPSCTATAGTRCASGGQSAGVTILPQPTGTGSCNASATTLSVPPSTWTRTGEACAASRALTDAGCSADSLCATDPPAGFLPKLCIWKAGAGDCSTTAALGYSLLYQYYSGTTDTRQCTKGTCACNLASVSECTLTSAMTYRTATCGNGGAALTYLGLQNGNQNCNATPNLIAGVTAGVSTTGSCAVVGTAQTSGSVRSDPTTEFTVCCAQ